MRGMQLASVFLRVSLTVGLLIAVAYGSRLALVTVLALMGVAIEFLSAKVWQHDDALDQAPAWKRRSMN